MTLFLIATGVAQAACPAPYGRGDLANDLALASQSITDMSGQVYQGVAYRMENGLPCIDAANPAAVYATVYRTIGAARFSTGNEAEARRWFRISLELDSTYEWDVHELSPDHPMRTLFDDERGMGGATEVEIDGAADLEVPDGSYLILDGRPWTRPLASVDRPHLFQEVRSDDGAVVFSQVIEGNTFPGAYLLSTKEKEAQEQEAKKESASYNVQNIKRQRPPMKTPMLAVGGVGLVASGYFYMQSMASRDTFDDATTTEDVLDARSKTNTQFTLAAASFAFGVGAGYYGFMLDSTPRVGWSMRW